MKTKFKTIPPMSTDGVFFLTKQQAYVMLQSFQLTAALAEELAAMPEVLEAPESVSVAAPAYPTTYVPEAPVGTVATVNMSKVAGRLPSPVAVIVPEPVPTSITKVQDIGVNMGAVVNGETIETVNARQLHAFLQVGKDFSNWIKDRIEKYGFKDGVDFTTIIGSPVLANQIRGGDRRSIDYHISLDMAKELAMVERSAKGKEARQYFIECEKKLRGTAYAPALHQSAVLACQFKLSHLVAL